MKNKLIILFYFTFYVLGCQDNSSDVFMKNALSINFDEIETIDNDIKTKYKNKVSLLINKDTIQTLINFNHEFQLKLPRYKISFENDSVFVETLTNKILFLSTNVNDTIPLIDIRTLDDKYPTFIGLNIYLKDSIIKILGHERECFVLKQMTGRYISIIYTNHRIVFIDKKRLIMLKQEDVFFDAVLKKYTNKKIKLCISNLL